MFAQASGLAGGRRQDHRAGGVGVQQSQCRSLQTAAELHLYSVPNTKL